MGRALRKTCSFFLCIVMLSALCAAPVAATDSGGGTYVIHSVTMEDGADTAYVEVTSENDSVLFVALYDAMSGAMRGVGSSGITEAVVRQAVPVEVSCKKGNDATVKAFLLNAASFAPLCQSVSAGNSEDTPYYSVVFLRNDGSEGYYDLQMVQAGKRATMPNAPERELYGFIGWYTESETVTAYDFSAPVDGNLMLYAGWGAPDGSPGLYSAKIGGETVYSVTGITMSDSLDEVRVTFNANSSEALVVDFMDEESNDILFSVGAITPSYAELETISIPVTRNLPEHFIIRARILGEEQEPLCDDYECIKYTSLYAQFAEITLDDFAGEPTVNFDEDSATNFGVLNSSVIWIDSTEETNILTIDEVDLEDRVIPERTYILSNIDDVASNLQIGDSIYIKGTQYLMKIKTLTKTGTSITFTADDDVELEDFYDVLKVNMSAIVDNQPASGEEAQLMVDLIDVDTSLSHVVSHSTQLHPRNSIGEPVDWMGLEFSIEGTVKCEIEINYDAHLFSQDYIYCSVVTEADLEVQLGVTVEPDMDDIEDVISEKLELPKFQYPTPVPGLTVYGKISIPIELSGSLSVVFNAEIKSGFIYDSNSGRQTVDSKKYSQNLDVQAEVEIAFGPKIAIGVAFLEKVVEAEVGAWAGLDITATISAHHEAEESRHACAVCIEGEIKWFVTVEAKMSYDIGILSGDVFDVELLRFEAWVEILKQNPGKFYVSLVNDEDSIYGGHVKFGGGECENKQYRTVFETLDNSGSKISIPVSVKKTNNSEAANGTSSFTAYLYSGIYTANATIGGIAVRKTFTVDEAAQTVELTPLSADGRLTGTILDAVTNNPLPDVSIVAMQGQQEVAAAQTDNAGTFFIALPAGDSGIRISKDGYTAYTCYETVQDGETRDMQTIRLVPGDGKGGFSGKITDAATGNPVEGVTLRLRAGWNNSEVGDIIRTLTTDSNGGFEYNMVTLGSLIIHGLDAGNYTLTAYKVGYETASFNIMVYPGVVLSNQDGTIVASQVSIPDDATYFNGHAYKMYDLSMTWDEAREYAESMNGHLATITSESEQLFVVDIIRNGSKRGYWLGGSDHKQEGHWEWTTGEEWSYSNWDRSQPDNSGKNEHYLHIYNVRSFWNNSVSIYKWNDLSNDNKGFGGTDIMGLVCEWDWA